MCSGRKTRSRRSRRKICGKHQLPTKKKEECGREEPKKKRVRGEAKKTVVSINCSAIHQTGRNAYDLALFEALEHSVLI
jgi:hypothetical protein